ncbi:hypothetical protein AXG93_3818s1050 [Marchantia polymorpha subsp. ruderalis]|uniref:START domain-containing protein n=1 Tax=Marchantia polymorpha subsp. ruderalis TaxID=1480154 RepID=A0A176VHR0_MARPO|nr:hypothetical protein AXG93_3818s1050 [Marchantia polymorpha subsp. ruderalis]
MLLGGGEKEGRKGAGRALSDAAAAAAAYAAPRPVPWPCLPFLSLVASERAGSAHRAGRRAGREAICLCVSATSRARPIDKCMHGSGRSSTTLVSSLVEYWSSFRAIVRTNQAAEPALTLCSGVVGRMRDIFGIFTRISTFGPNKGPLEFAWIAGSQEQQASFECQVLEICLSWTSKSLQELNLAAKLCTSTRRLRGQFPHKRYFVLESGIASCYRAKPSNQDEEKVKAVSCVQFTPAFRKLTLFSKAFEASAQLSESSPKKAFMLMAWPFFQVPIRKGIIDPYTRVADNGRESIHGQVLFVFTVYDSFDNENQLKFGVRSAEEAAKWMNAFKAAAEQGPSKGKVGAFVPSSGKRRLPFRRRSNSGLVSYPSNSQEAFSPDDGGVPDWTGALSFKEGSPDVVATSPWRIIGCKNGLRIFTETTDHPGFGLMNMLKEDQPALMAVGVVNASCESIFETVMALGQSRAEWDFCYLRGNVIEHIDGHTDVIHKQFHTRWIPWRMKPRDLVLLRYWRREDDGSYGGGYVISPLQSNGSQLNRSLVKHMITAEWKIWSSCLQPICAQDITLRVLERVAAIRELYKARSTVSMLVSSPSTDTLAKDAINANGTVKSAHEGKGGDGGLNFAMSPEPAKSPSNLGEGNSPFLQLGDGDEFYDVQEDASWWKDPENFDGPRRYREVEGILEEDDKHKDCKSPGGSKLSAAATIVKRLHDLASSVQKKQHNEVGMNDEDVVEVLSKEGTLLRGGDAVTGSCWNTADADTFLIRGKQYLRDNRKVKAEQPWMQFIAADWFKSNKREDHLASRPSNLVQTISSKFQVPGTTTYSLVLYYMTHRRLEDDPILEKFVNGDDRLRNSRFKLIPHIAKGSWIVKQSVGKTACLIGQALTINYHTGSNYIELDVDIGSSSVAKGVVNLVLGYLSKLVIEMAFLIQANTEDELPEHLLGTCRLSYLDINKAVPAIPE